AVTRRTGAPYRFAPATRPPLVQQNRQSDQSGDRQQEGPGLGDYGNIELGDDSAVIVPIPTGWARDRRPIEGIGKAHEQSRSYDRGIQLLNRTCTRPREPISDVEDLAEQRRERREGLSDRSRAEIEPGRCRAARC